MKVITNNFSGFTFRFKRVIIFHFSFFIFHFSFFTFHFSLFTFHFASAQQLEVLIDEALKNNPEIKTVERQYNIASEQVNEVNTIPNTEFSAGYFASEPETRTGAQRFKVSVRQMLPWFGSITARENYAGSLAEAKYEDLVIAKRKLIASVSQSYYKLYELNAKQAVLADNIALLKTYETLALNAVEVGKASAVDVLRLQIRQNELEQSKQVLAQLYLAEQTACNKLLNREKSIAINVADALIIPLESDLVTENLAVHPELVKYDKLYQSVEQSELLNQKERKPMLGFGLDYIAVSERPNLDFNDNGKDIAMPYVMLSIPIFNKKYKSRSHQNKLKQQELIFQKEERQNTLETLMDKALYQRSSARISYNTQLKNLQQAKEAESVLIKSYETGGLDFNDVLDIQELQLKLQINQIESVKDYYVQTTIINYLSH